MVILHPASALKETDNTLSIVRPVFIVISDSVTPFAGA